MFARTGGACPSAPPVLEQFNTAQPAETLTAMSLVSPRPNRTGENVLLAKNFGIGDAAYLSPARCGGGPKGAVKHASGKPSTWPLELQQAQRSGIPPALWAGVV